MTRLELWGGVECTVNRVGDRYFDQQDRSGHSSRLDDIDRFATLGVSALRQPVLWERLAPASPGEIDWRSADAPLARLRELNIRPIVGLVHHGSGPRYTSLIDPAFATGLAKYARAVAERFPWVTDWTPVNEPLTTARFSGLYGHWYPHARDDRQFVRALLNQLRGVVLAMQEVRAVNPAARLVQTEDVGRTSGTRRVRRQVDFERHRRWLTWDLLSGCIGPQHPMYGFLRYAGATEAELASFVDHPCPPDILGINYYVTSDRWLDDRLALYSPAVHGGNGQLAYADLEAVRAEGRGIAGHERHLLDAWERYRRPLAITEVHLGCTRDEQMRWFVEAWRGAQRAAARGADVRAVTAWALLGSHDWNSLATRDTGHYEPGVFDIRSPAPRPTALAGIVRDLAGGRRPEHPVLRSDGWWRRPSRLIGDDRVADDGAPVGGPPILIVGARGTLGRAFQRMCQVRGLRTHVTGRAELDIAEPAAVDAVLRRTRPWAVVNAAGYVRVDAAEQDRDRCWKDNVAGAVTLAAACRRHRLPLVTFSSDLVFDGAAGRPYTEEDPPAPIGAYGASKAEAERRVLDLLPEALVVRTSAFFGPWDDHNFATVLLRSLEAGRSVTAPSDAIVSPTYVPDLVHATLDLLIDGERGVWHLANDGAASWYEFGRLVAARAGLPEHLVTPCGWRELWQPAARPPFSALASARGQVLRTLDAAIDAYTAELFATGMVSSAGCASS